MTHGTIPDPPRHELPQPVTGILHGERLRTVRTLGEALGGLDGRQIAVLGAMFVFSPGMPDAGDASSSPGLQIASLLVDGGASVAIYDPVLPPSRILQCVPEAAVTGALMDAAHGADAIVIASDWLEFRNMDLKALRRTVASAFLVDVCRAIQPERAERSGFVYLAPGYPASECGPAVTSLGVSPRPRPAMLRP